MNSEERLVGKEVQLMITCLCDTFYSEVARATVEVLEHVGCRVEVPDGQTCCGQPAFNSGDWPAARQVIRHTLQAFSGDKPIILPSGSCQHMIGHGYPLALEKDLDLDAARAFGRRAWELCDFLVHGLGIRTWPGTWQGSVAVHRSCHTRGTRTYEAAQTLLQSIEGLQWLDFDESEQCCGFGGTFSVAYPNTSLSMGQRKIEKLTAPAPQWIGAVDMACMLHLGGIADKENLIFRRKHVAEILFEALQNSRTQPTVS